MAQDFSPFRFLLKALLIIPLSWVLVHVFAVFGVFLALAYPVWWLIAPSTSHCLICRAKREGAYCSMCQRKIVKSDGCYPENLRSAFLNGLLILLFSMLSIGLVGIESQILFKFGFPARQKTASFVIPAKGQYRIGEIFPLKIQIDNIKNPINAVQADIGFDSTKIEVIEVSTEDSFANIFIQKEINQEGGWVRLTGGLPNPGFYGDHGLFGTVYFKALTPGLVKIDFLSSSMVITNDSRGTNILKGLPSASYLIVPEKISAEEAEQQKKLLTSRDVLGAATDDTQMKFYEDKGVLGIETQREIEDSQNPNIGSRIYAIIETIDRFTVSFWSELAQKFI